MKLDIKLSFLNRLRLRQKFMLLGVFALAAVAIPFYSFILADQYAIEFAQEELSGVGPMNITLKTIQLVQQHRGLSAAVLGGNEAQAEPRRSKEAEVNQTIATMDKQLAEDGRSTLQESWAKLKQEWKTLAEGVTNQTTDTRKSFDAHTQMIARILLFVELVADDYKLSLDPDPHTYFLIQATSNHLPALVEKLGQARALGAGRLAEAARLRATSGDPTQAITEADRIRMSNILSSLQESTEASYRFIDKAINAKAEIRAKLEQEALSSKEASVQLEQLARKEIIAAPVLNFDSSTYLKTFTNGIDAQFKFIATISNVLQEEIAATIVTRRRHQIINTVEILVALVLAVLVATFTVRNITSTVNTLQHAVERVRAGDATALQQVEAQDEVGDLGRTVNDLLEEGLAVQKKIEAEKKKAEDENDTLNNSVITLLTAVNQLSQRDLTVRAPVTQDIIGTVADSVNQLTEETGRVLQGVSDIAHQVEKGSGNVRSQGQLVTQTAAADRISVGQMIERLAKSTVSMNQVVDLTVQSNKSSEQATLATATALETVNSTVKGMESIRETMAETEKRIKRLGERSQEISGIVNLINTISERTHVLALNASMQAAVAGEAGRGFAVVAEEVQRLAESSRNATQQISTLVSNIQLETNETTNTVNRTISQVVQGSELAHKAGEQMRVTQQRTAELVGQVQRIATASEQQKALSAELLETVQSIGKSSERTSQQIDTQNTETEALLGLARNLVQSVSVFKLKKSA